MTCHRSLLSSVLCTILLIVGALFADSADAQSRTGSQAASELIAGGSVLITSGTASIIGGTAELVVTSVETTAHGVSLVLRPVADGVSQAAEFSAAVTIEVSHAAWEAATSAAHASGRALEASAVTVSDIITTVALTTSAVGETASAVVVGTVLMIGDVVLGIVASDELGSMLGHGVHSCSHAGH